MIFRLFLYLMTFLGPVCVSIEAPAETEDHILRLSSVPDKGSFLIGRYLSRFMNVDDQTSPAKILAGEMSEKFGPVDNDLLAEGFFRGSVWLRLEIDNDLGSPQELVLDSRFAPIDEVTLYQKGDAEIFLAESQGDSVPYEIEAPLYRHPIFKLSVKPGRQLYYISVKSAGSSVVYLTLSKPETHRRYEFFDTMVLSFFFGTIVTLLLYNSFLTISLMSRTYIYYTLFMVGMALNQVGLQGLWPQILPFKLSLWAQNTGITLSLPISYGMAGLVTQSFLNTKKHMPRFHNFLTAYVTTSVLIFPLALIFDYNTNVQISTIAFSIGSIAIIIGCILSMLRGYRPAFAFGVAWLFFLTSNLSLAVLLRGHWHSSALVQWGNLPGLVCEGILMSFALASRVNYFRARADATIKGLNDDLKQNLVQVEALVAERTETIRTILDNVASGFLMIGRDCRVLPGYTRSCETILQVPVAQGSFIQDLMQMTGDTSKRFRLAVEQIFADLLPLEASIAQLPQDISAKGRAFRLEAAPIRDTDGSVISILLTITDASELKLNKREANRNRKLVKQLSDINGFRQFIASSVQAVAQLKALTLQDTADRRNIALILHTLKGNCALFQLNTISNFIHILEEKEHLSISDFRNLESRFVDYLVHYQKFLQTPWSEIQDFFHITREDLSSLRHLIRDSEAARVGEAVHGWLKSIEATPVSTTFRALAADAKRVSRRISKPIEIELIDNGIRLQSPDEQKLIEEFVHLIRNALVHGIEDDRKVVHKTAHGSIRLEARELSNALWLSCRDDGRGFDPKQWESAWLDKNRGLDPPLRLIELVRGMTKHGYSTAGEISIYAGRGAGMEAFFQAADRCGAHIDLNSTPGIGSEFIVMIPRAMKLVKGTEVA